MSGDSGVKEGLLKSAILR